MILGFTGTRDGMTVAQITTVLSLFQEHLTELHHGDSEGSDLCADMIAMNNTQAHIVVHPPTDSKRRAHCSGPRHTVLPPKPFLKRNWSIVYAGIDGLVATPHEFIEPKSLRGQGTWTTINYARKAGRHIWIVSPDGTVKEETNG